MFNLKPYNFKHPVLVSATDGVGTKLEIANRLNKFDTIGIDLVAMCVNDLIVQGARPLFFLDYISINKINLKNDIKRLDISSISDFSRPLSKIGQLLSKKLGL